MNCLICEQELWPGCFAHGDLLTDADKEWFDAPAAVDFQATGNFGTTIFDPLHNSSKEVLQIAVCDECLIKKQKIIKYINVKNERKPIIETFEEYRLKNYRGRTP